MGIASFHVGDDSWLSTPNTPDLTIPTDLRFLIDVALDVFKPVTNLPVIMESGSTEGQSVSLSSAGVGGNIVFHPKFTKSGSPTSVVIPDAQRNEWVCIYKSGFPGYTFFRNGEAAGTSLDTTIEVGVPDGGVALGNNLLGNTFDGSQGRYFRFELGRAELAPVLVFDAEDATFPNGSVADGSTFTSNGRVWTIHGANVSFNDGTYVGSFALNSEATLDFAGVHIQNFVGDFGLVGEAALDFDGVHLPPLDGDFGLVGEAALDFAGESFKEGAFELEATALLGGWAGESEADGEFAMVGTAALSGWTGEAEASGSFGLEGTADLTMIWTPELCPGTSAVGCAGGIPSVANRPYPASACLCHKENC